MIRKQQAANIYRSAGLEVYMQHADPIGDLKARGTDTALVVDDEQFAEALWLCVKKSRTPDEAILSPMYKVAEKIRRSAMHPLEALIEYQRALTTLEVIASSKYSEDEVHKVGHQIVQMAPKLLDLDLGEDR